MVEADRRSRILYVVPPSQQFAGIERVVHHVARALSVFFGTCLEVHVIYFSRYTELEAEETVYQLHQLKAERLRDMFIPFYKFLKKEKFDVIICCQVETSAFCWFASKASNSNAYFIPYLHGNPKIEENASLASRVVFGLYRFFVAPKAACVLAVSESLADYVRKNLSTGVPVQFAPNPAHTLSRPVENQKSEPLSFVSVARLHRQKGHDVLLKAFAKVHAALPAAKLTLVGDGPERVSLESLAESLGVSKYVTFAGFTNPSPFLAAASCFVLASRWEGFGIVLIEALSFGLPIVVTNCDFGCRDLVTDPRLGRVCKVEDVDSLASAMIDVATAEPDVDAIALRYKKADEFSISRVVQQHFRLIDNVVNGKSHLGKAPETVPSAISVC